MGTLAAVILAAAGCSTKPKEEVAIDPNTFPADYRTQIATFLRQSLTDRADFRGAVIAQPVLKPIGDSQRYVVCVQLHGRSQFKTKVAIYFGGRMAQFIDASPAQCSDATYQPFKELEAAMPPQ